MAQLDTSNPTEWNIYMIKLLCSCVTPVQAVKPHDDDNLIHHYECDFCQKMHRKEFQPKFEDMVGLRCECEFPVTWECGFQCAACKKLHCSDEHVFPYSYEYESRRVDLYVQLMSDGVIEKDAARVAEENNTT